MLIDVLRITTSLQRGFLLPKFGRFMRHIIKGHPERTERATMKAALNLHQTKYGDYGPTKKGVTYYLQVEDEKFAIEIINREKSYVATSMMRPRDLSKVWGDAA